MTLIRAILLPAVIWHGAWSCGIAGRGERRKKRKPAPKRINQERFDQINVARPQTLALVCPFCMPQMQDAVKSRSLEETMRLRDLAELIAESTGATGK